MPGESAARRRRLSRALSAKGQQAQPWALGPCPCERREQVGQAPQRCSGPKRADHEVAITVAQFAAYGPSLIRAQPRAQPERIDRRPDHVHAIRRRAAADETRPGVLTLDGQPLQPALAEGARDGPAAHEQAQQVHAAQVEVTAKSPNPTAEQLVRTIERAGEQSDGGRETFLPSPPIVRSREKAGPPEVPQHDLGAQ